MGGNKESTSQKRRSKRWARGEESRYPGNSCCGEEQMALGGAVMAGAPGHPSTNTLYSPILLSTSSPRVDRYIFHSLCPLCPNSWVCLNNVTKSIPSIICLRLSVLPQTLPSGISDGPESGSSPMLFDRNGSAANGTRWPAPDFRRNRVELHQLPKFAEIDQREAGRIRADTMKGEVNVSQVVFRRTTRTVCVCVCV